MVYKVLKEILAESVPNLVKDINLKIWCIQQDELKEIHSLIHHSQKTLETTKKKLFVYRRKIILAVAGFFSQTTKVEKGAAFQLPTNITQLEWQSAW